MIVIFLLINSIIDIKKREISLYTTVPMIVIGVVKRLNEKNNLYEYLLEIIIGIVIVIMGLVKEKAIGSGDGLIILALSGFMELYNLLNCILVALFMVIIISTISIIFNRKKLTFPFCPFLLLAYIGGVI